VLELKGEEWNGVVLSIKEMIIYSQSIVLV
jgi:hypothetical protein